MPQKINPEVKSAMLCARGAVTTENTVRDIIKDTKTMLGEIINANNISSGDIISVIFTATRDIDAAYPAVAARELGLTRAALMCAQEMYVNGSLEKCVRAAVYFNPQGDKSQENVRHVYLKGAGNLRPDLIGE